MKEIEQGLRNMGFIRCHIRMANQVFGAISGLAIFIMLFSILSMMNTLITNIVTRKQELAMLESIGMGKGQIRKMLLGESLLLVFATIGVTLTIGTLCGYIMSNILYQMGAHYMAFKFPTVFALIYVAIHSFLAQKKTAICSNRWLLKAILFVEAGVKSIKVLGI